MPFSLALEQVVGDDILVTNPERVKRAIEAKAVNALLLKVGVIPCGWGNQGLVTSGQR